MNAPLATGPARYIMIGGFLGAGKTTAVARLARHLTDLGLRVGLITNDQGSRLVDTASLSARGFAVEEIVGGCFCCRFQSLTEAADKLSQSNRPDVFLAEPVGSCTDLVATVTYPLRRIYGNRFVIAPLSVLMDPIRAMRVLGLADGPKFSDKVAYIYRKQLEEADLLVINKCDLISKSERDALRASLVSFNPRAEVLEVSARQGDGLGAWFERLQSSEQAWQPVMAVDYREYGEGEALLGWLNATLSVSAKSGFDGNAFLGSVASRLQAQLAAAGAEVAHLKMTLDPQAGLGELGVINLVRSDYVPELSQTLEEDIEGGQVVLNLRAETHPDVLREAVARVVASFNEDPAGAQLRVDHLECFQPGQPKPTHRVTEW